MRTGVRPRTAPYGYHYQPRRRIPWASIAEAIGGLLVLFLFFGLVWFWLAVGP